MKGIILAGGSGSRLYPMTACISKQLLPVYNKPMIYYPLSMMLLSGIKEVLIITDEKSKKVFQSLLGNGDEIGIKLSYDVQKKPRGIAESFLIGEKFIGKSPVCLALGDNIFYGNELSEHIQEGIDSVKQKKAGAVVFGYPVKNPEDYGVLELDENNKVVQIQEKPKEPKTNWAVTGFYVYDNTCIEKAKSLNPSGRKELEITDLNNLYIQENSLDVVKLGRGHAWFDTGTFESFFEATNFIRSVENRQGLMIGNIHEIAYRFGYTSKKTLINFIENCGFNDYKSYLERLLKEL